MENVLRENRFETIELKRDRDECKNQLRVLSEQQKQYQLRESMAHAKMEDAIQMVEAAIAEKNEALQREKEIRGKLIKFCNLKNQGNNLLFCIDECDQLALTIARVMEEAGDKVDTNIDEIKSDYSQRMQKLEAIIKKVNMHSNF